MWCIQTLGFSQLSLLIKTTLASVTISTEQTYGDHVNLGAFLQPSAMAWCSGTQQSGLWICHPSVYFWVLNSWIHFTPIPLLSHNKCIFFWSQFTSWTQFFHCYQVFYCLKVDHMLLQFICIVRIDFKFPHVKDCLNSSLSLWNLWDTPVMIQGRTDFVFGTLDYNQPRCH